MSRFVQYCNYVCNFWRTDRQTDGPTDLGIKAPSWSLKTLNLPLFNVNMPK